MKKVLLKQLKSYTKTYKVLNLKGLYN